MKGKAAGSALTRSDWWLPKTSGRGGEEVRESETDTQRGSEESGEDTEDLSASDL